MRDLSLFIIIIGAILVGDCSSNSQSFGRSIVDEPLRMASESLVVKSYKDAESSTLSTTKGHGDRLEEYQVYQGVMGRPGIDFPVHPHIPATSFSCRGVKKSGYYADLETDCQVFHICDGNRKISFLCPNGTIFRQSHLICDWWFRVDCGKSIELYEESAEQLAADQKIYKARSEERERRRKLNKATENGEELTSSEVYALDEPFHIKSRKSNQNRNNQNLSRGPAGRNIEDRKAERHSKKVSDSGMSEKFPAYNREKLTGRATERIRTAKPTVQYSTPPSVTTYKVSFVDTTTLYSTSNYKARNQAQNSINYVNNNKENIQLAESGNLFNDFNNRNSENDSRRVDQTEYNKNIVYNNNLPGQQNLQERGKVNQTLDITNSFAYTQNAKTEINKSQIESVANTENKRNDEVNNKNINFYFNQKDSSNNRGIIYNNQRLEQTGRTNSDQKDDFQYTTEFYNYESKKTNPVEKQETVTPTFHTRNGKSSKYRSSTPLYEEHEKQFFAETASFASNRGSKSYFDFQNQFNTYNKAPSTTSPYKTTFYTTSKTPETYSSIVVHNTGFQNNQDYFRTTTYRPVKQHSKKVTLYPSTSPHTSYSSTVSQTTYQPIVETTTRQYTVEDIYFTTTTPENKVDIFTETRDFVPQKQLEFQVSSTNPKSPKPDVHITLQELNINKNPVNTESKNKSYEDFVREGLEVPPSSGPNAIRSFALYYATANGNIEEGKTTVYFPSAEPNFTTTLTPFEIKKKEVVKQVDELVQRSSTNVSDHLTKEELPNSLTSQVQNSYSALFPNHETENKTSTMADRVDVNPTESFETTAFESYTEEPTKINTELTKNDLDGSQSRGLVEPDPHSDTDYSKVSPDLRELAQVFTKALSAYLDDPEAFRKVLSEIRPTEPSSGNTEHSGGTQDDDEVLDFSDVTKSTFKKKTTPSAFKESTTEYIEPSTTNPNDIENLVLPVNQTNWATNIELTAPFLESLDQSQSNYYTPPPYVGTTNAIAEEINHEFTTVVSNDTIDSYLPLKGSADDSSLPRYGGFQNNTNPTTKYSPYGAELTSTTYLPYGADLTPISNTVASIVDATTFNPNNVTSFFNHFSKNESEEGEVQLAKELNNLVLLQKFTTPRGSQKEISTEPNLSTVSNEINQFQNVLLGNGEILEKSVRAGKSLHFPKATISSNDFEPNARDINLELSPPSSTPKGFLITYSLGRVASSEPATYLPKATTQTIQPTTYSPGKQTTYFEPETYAPTTNAEFENFSERLERLSKSKSFTTPKLPTTNSFAKSTESIEKLALLQETLMFNTNNVTLQQRDQARISVEEMMDKMNMTDTTANTLMKVMEMAAKNETYRRLVLLLVNDKSGKNKTVEEARLSLLKALLTPVINPPRTAVPIHETARLAQTEPRRRSGTRRGKSIKSESVRTTTVLPTTQKRPTNSKRVKNGRGLARSESNYQSGLGNLGLIRRTIENSKNKQVRLNSLDDAILDSDSRAVELLRSLYSLAARWG